MLEPRLEQLALAAAQRRVSGSASVSGNGPSQADDSSDEVGAEEQAVYAQGVAPEEQKRHVTVGTIPPPLSLTGSAPRPTGEDHTRPCRRLGVNRPRMVSPGDVDYDAKVAQYGDLFNVIGDLAAAGCGVIRQPEGVDPIWGYVFPYEAEDPTDDAATAARKAMLRADAVIPPPADLYARLVADYYLAFAPFGLAVVACALAGVRIIPTVFTYGGGWRPTDEGVVDPANGSDGQPNLKKINAHLSSAQSVRHQARAVIVTEAGWDEFYWAETQIEPMLMTYQTVTPDALAYHQFALLIRPGDDDEYADEVARRKQLAVAAFGQAFGEFLALIRPLIEGITGQPLGATIPYVECGNEMDVCWKKAAPDGTNTADTDGAAEYGRFHFLVASSVAQGWTDARFMAAGLASYAARISPEDGTDEWLTRLDWLHHACGPYLQQIGGRFEVYAEAVETRRSGGSKALLSWLTSTTHDFRYSAFDWANTCAAAGWFWPPEPPDTVLGHDRLLHAVSFHYYHHYNQMGSKKEVGYCSDDIFAAECGEFIEQVVRPLTTDFGIELAWAIPELGFPAAEPADTAITPAHDAAWYAGTDERFQAGMLARRVLIGIGSGAEFVAWHTIESSVATTRWTSFSAMGLRRDVKRRGDPAFTVDEDASRRSSWLTFRRLSWLLSRANAVSVATRGAGSLVVRLDSSAGFLLGTERWRTAAVAWRDQMESGTNTVGVGNQIAADFLRLSLTADVVRDPKRVDANGFVANELPIWNWPGWDSVPVRAQPPGAEWYLLADVEPASLTFPVPVLVFGSKK